MADARLSERSALRYTGRQWPGAISAADIEHAITVLEPPLAQGSHPATGPSGETEREEHPPAARVLASVLAAGPALIPALRQAAAQGIASETIGKLLVALGESGAPPAGTPPGAPAASTSFGLAEPLSEREIEVLRLVAAGLTNAEIAAQLFLAVGTVKRQIFNLYGKLGANSRTSGVVRARELGLL